MELIGDIGATNARFQCVEGGARSGEVWLGETSRFSSTEGLLQEACGDLGAHFDRTAIAVAGPQLGDGSIRVTNGKLHFTVATCRETLQCPVTLINDFYAVAKGVPYFRSLEMIGGTPRFEDLTKAVLGPGTGLGMATVSPVGNGVWHVLAGEGGHADLSPGSHLETELWSILIHEFGHVSWETVLSGQGIENLYRATSMMWGVQPEDKSAVSICAAGVSIEDPVCHQSMELFAGLLGSAAGNLALTVGAKGGVYIAGGIAPRMVEFLKGAPVRRRFEEKGAMSDYVKDIPLYVVTEAQPGLEGALHCL